MAFNPVFDSGFNLMESEYTTKGKCGPITKGVCNMNRFCNNNGECGPEQTHRDNSNNNIYRFCNQYNDTNCMSFADKHIDGRILTFTNKDNYQIYGLKKSSCSQTQ